MHGAKKTSHTRIPHPGRPFAWHHIRGQVPADWEITAYSVEDRAGRLEFNTRHGLQAVVSWEPCKREPDRLSTMATFLANNIIGRKNAGKLRATDIATGEIGPFLLGWLDETLPCQAMGHDPRGGQLIRWVFEGHSSKADREHCIRPILESCDFNQDPAACEYNIHGVHARLPWDYKIEDMVVLPANVMLSFESEASMRRATLRRWGLAEMIRGGQSLAGFYTPILRTNGIHVDACAPCRVDTWEARTLRFNAPREHHSERFMRRRWHNGTAVIWHDEAQNRIYTFEQIGPDGTGALDFNTVIPGRRLKESHA